MNVGHPYSQLTACMTGGLLYRLLCANVAPDWIQSWIHQVSSCHRWGDCGPGRRSDLPGSQVSERPMLAPGPLYWISILGLPKPIPSVFWEDHLLPSECHNSQYFTCESFTGFCHSRGSQFVPEYSLGALSGELAHFGWSDPIFSCC